MSEKSHARLVLVLAGAFFLSGFSALLYQVVWQRMLGLFTGSDVQSVTMIAGAYLAGLGVGGVIGSVIADRLSSRRAVYAYAVCNLVITLFAAFSRLFYYDFLFQRATVLTESPVIMLLVLFLSLLIPTTLMGISLPLVAKAVVRTVSSAAALISRIYAINTLGAGLGSFIAGWLLIGTFGYEGTLYIGAAVSAIVGVIAYLAAPRFTADDAVVHMGKMTLRDAFRLPSSVWGWCGLVFASGFIVISLEIVWFRFLDFILKSSVYTYGHVLAFFLIADALGSLYGTRIVQKINEPRRAFLILQALIAIYALAMTWVLAIAALNHSGIIGQYIAVGDGRLTPLLSGGYYGLTALIYFVIPFVVIAPPAFMVGMYFPIVQKAIQTDKDVVGQRTGMVEVANIAGNTAGAIFTGLALIAWFGTPGTLKIIGLIGVAFMGVLILTDKQRRRLAGGLALALVVLVIAFPGIQEFWGMMHARGDAVFLVSEDATGVSAIVAPVGANAKVPSIITNGRDQGSMPPYIWHTFIGAVPSLIHPDPHNAMLIGLGSGGTPYSVGARSSLQNITVVELIGSEMDVLRTFSTQDPRAAFLESIFTDPRYTFIVGDGRRELALSDQQYDLIVVDAVLPWTSHAGLLYSTEFYDLVRQHLAPGGFAVTWRPTDRTEATFTHAFPYVTILSEIVMIGSNEPIVYDRDALLAALDQQGVRDYLAQAGTTPEDYNFWLRQGGVTVHTPDSELSTLPTVTDLFPRDEYYLNNDMGVVHFPASNVGWVGMR